MEKLLAVCIGVAIWGYALSYLAHQIRRAKQGFVHGDDDWFCISLICLAAFILGAMFIFGS